MCLLSWFSLASYPHFKPTKKRCKAISSLSSPPDSYSKRPAYRSFSHLESNTRRIEFIYSLSACDGENEKWFLNFLYVSSVERRETGNVDLIWQTVFGWCSHTVRTRELSCIISENMTLIVWVFIITRPFILSVGMDGWMAVAETFIEPNDKWLFRWRGKRRSLLVSSKSSIGWFFNVRCHEGSRSCHFC